MITSMTGFAQRKIDYLTDTFSCELRSVNQRYLEFSVRMPEALRELEMPLREQARQALQRGKVECFIRQQTTGVDAQSWQLNSKALASLAHLLQQAETETHRNVTIDALALLQWPGVLIQPEVNQETLQQAILSLFNATLKDLITARQREGTELEKILLQRLSMIETEVAKINLHAKDLISLQRQRLQAKIAELSVTIEPQRLEQEIVLQAQKADIAEELDRLTTHIAELRRILQQGGSVGRRLDFLIQELHREANTLASKSTDTSVTQSSIEIRVLIDQMREQVQNLE